MPDPPTEPIEVSSHTSVRVFQPRGWEDRHGNWVDAAEYVLADNGQLYYTTEFIWGDGPTPDVPQEECWPYDAASMAAVQGVYPDPAYFRVAEEAGEPEYPRHRQHRALRAALEAMVR